MSDLQQRLRDAITASVDGEEPTFDVMQAVRRRHRQRLRRQAAAGAAAAVMVVAAASILLARHEGPADQPPAAKSTGHAKPGRALFPGGGRLLLGGSGVLRWLYSDGRTAWIPGSFDGADVAAGALLAWKDTRFGASYYTMHLNGSHQLLILPAGHDTRLSVINALLSPDGSELAYIRQDEVSQSLVTDTLWVLNLATGHRADLGPTSGSAFSWLDDATILTAPPDSKSLLVVSAASGSRSTYLTVTDPVLVRAYEHARPGAGPPAYIGSDGLTGPGQAPRIAVWLAAASRHQGIGLTRPAEVIMTAAGLLVTYAPKTPQGLILTWGPRDLVLLRTGAGDNPGSWHAYVATLQSSQLSKPFPFGMQGATFNPAGNVIALQDDGVVTFVPTPQPACDHTPRCLSFHVPIFQLQGETVEAWMP
jgi:hypothetical protein